MGASSGAVIADRFTDGAIPYWYSDGGRAAAGFRGDAGDCVTRAIAIAGCIDYRTLYDDLAARQAATGRPRSARNGVMPAVYRAWFADNGWAWTPTMHIGAGCTVHLRTGEVPATGAHVIRLSKHLVAVIDGVVFDTYDPSRDGSRCVYGYWTAPAVTS